MSKNSEAAKATTQSLWAGLVFLILSILGPLFSLPAAMAGQDDPQGFVRVSGRIEVGWGLEVDASALCQDGQYLFFKDVGSCKAANSALTAAGVTPIPRAAFDCKSDLSIVPIQEIEEIFIPEAPTKSILNFYSNRTDFEVRTYTIIDSGQLPARYKLVNSETRKVPYCAGRPRLRSTSIYGVRRASPIQKYLIQALLNNGVYVLNMPHGSFNSINRQLVGGGQARARFKFSTGLNLGDGDRDKPAFTWLSGQLPPEAAAVLHSAAPRPSPVRVKTPYCNPNISERDIHALLGGDRTGGGFKFRQVEALQSLSAGLEIHSKLSPSEWAALERQPFDASVSAFDLQCLPSF